MLGPIPTQVYPFSHSHFRFSDDLVKKVKVTIRTLLSPRHVPSIILETTDIPVSARKLST